MSASRLGRLAETDEVDETETDDNTEKPVRMPTKERNGSARSLGQLHVTIKEPDEMDPPDNYPSKSNNSGSSRRPSVLVQEILSTRRPSAIMQALRSPKQFVNRYRRE